MKSAIILTGHSRDFSDDVVHPPANEFDCLSATLIHAGIAFLLAASRMRGDTEKTNKERET